MALTTMIVEAIAAILVQKSGSETFSGRFFVLYKFYMKIYTSLDKYKPLDFHRPSALLRPALQLHNEPVQKYGRLL